MDISELDKVPILIWTANFFRRQKDKSAIEILRWHHCKTHRVAGEREALRRGEYRRGGGGGGVMEEIKVDKEVHEKWRAEVLKEVREEVEEKNKKRKRKKRKKRKKKRGTGGGGGGGGGEEQEEEGEVGALTEGVEGLEVNGGNKKEEAVEEEQVEEEEAVEEEEEGEEEGVVDEEEDCAVCLWPLEEEGEEGGGEKVEVLSCGHKFHVSCVDSWTSKCSLKAIECTCPLCRGPIVR